VVLAFGFVLGYMGLLYFGAIIVPGIGLSGHLITQLPDNLLDWVHAPTYGILALLLNRGLQHRAWPPAYAVPVAAAAALVFGLWTEVFQGSVQGREASVEDLVVDAIGIGVASIFISFASIRNRIASLPS
jgi:VanZ family protein